MIAPIDSNWETLEPEKTWFFRDFFTVPLAYSSKFKYILSLTYNFRYQNMLPAYFAFCLRNRNQVTVIRKKIMRVWKTLTISTNMCPIRNAIFALLLHSYH